MISMIIIFIALYKMSKRFQPQLNLFECLFWNSSTLVFITTVKLGSFSNQLANEQVADVLCSNNASVLGPGPWSLQKGARGTKDEARAPVVHLELVRRRNAREQIACGRSAGVRYSLALSVCSYQLLLSFLILLQFDGTGTTCLVHIRTKLICICNIMVFMGDS